MSSTPLPLRLQPTDIPPSPAGSSRPPSERPTPTRKATALNSAAAENRRARREQLRDFYGLGGVGAGKGKGGPREGGGDPLDIDSPAFNPNLYYEDLITKSTLAQLMATASKLSADIDNLHSSRHSLVYNHHHQLFAAGDTISHLNSRTPQLLSIVTELQQSFSDISQLVDSVGPSAAEEALPPVVEGDDGEVNEGEKERAMNGARRLQLMLAARGSPDDIRAAFETFKLALEKLATLPGKTGEAAAEQLEQCRTIVEGLPGDGAINEKTD